MKIKRFKLRDSKGETKWYKVRLYDAPVALTEYATVIAESPGQRNIAGGFTGMSIPKYSLVETRGGKKLLITYRPWWDLDEVVGECVDDATGVVVGDITARGEDK
jgi:hypothetical protein